MNHPLARLALWTVAGAVLIHGIIFRLEPALTAGLIESWSGVVVEADSYAWQGVRMLDAALLGLLLGGLPPLVGLWGRTRTALLFEPLLGGLACALAATLLLVPLDLACGVVIPLPFDWPALVVGDWLHPALLGGLAILALATGGTAWRMLTLIGVEWLKIRRGRLLKAGLFVTAAATALAALSGAPQEGESGWTQASQALRVGFWSAEILALVLGATIVAGEINQGTMKMILPHAYRRAEWIAAKATVLLGCALLFTAVVCVIGIGWPALDAGLDDVTRVAPAGFGEDDAIEIFQTAPVMRGHLVDTVLAYGASLVASAIVGLLLSCLFHSLVPALSASFLIFAALRTGDVLLGLTPDTMDAIYAHYPDEMRRLFDSLGRALNESWDDTLLPGALQLGFLTGVLGLLAALRLFGRRDLHG